MSLRASTPGSRPAPHLSPVPLHALPQATAPAAQPAASGHRQNGVGDVVIPVDHGEIVALPRLWDFGLERVERDGATLRTDTGLTAVVTFLVDTAVVDGIADGVEGEREIA